MVSARDIITKVNSFGQQPDCPVRPVTIGQGGLGAPPTAETLVEGRKSQPEAFLVRKRELNVLDDEHPERSRSQSTGDSAVDVRADVDGAGQEMTLCVMRGTVCCGGISVGICSDEARRTGDRFEKSKDHS